MNAHVRRAAPVITGDRLAEAVAEFLTALDRGHLGTNALRFSDGSESAYVADLRTKLAEHRTDRNLVAQAHEIGRAFTAGRR